MDTPTIYETLLGLAASAGGWVLRTVYGELKEVKADLADHKVEVAKDYVTHDDLADIRDILHRIEDKLDRKQDK